MIRLFQPADWGATWRILEPVFRAGTTYAFSPGITESEAYEEWIANPSATFVYEENGDILGTYYIKPNQPRLGAHVCNCGYIVSEQARGRGLASALCEHSQVEARSRGFLGMQFNLVVSTNHSAIRLWQRHGFRILGTIPGAFQHPEFGFVDAHILYKSLTAPRARDSSSEAL